MKISNAFYLISILMGLLVSDAFGQVDTLSSEKMDGISLNENLLKQGKFHAHVRSYFMSTDNEKSLTDYYALAIGAGIGYESPVIHHFQFGLTGFFYF
jgi:hypothetical protein